MKRSHLARIIGATERDVTHTGKSMGLAVGNELNDEQRNRAALTIIRRNWHLLPYEQLLTLLGWTAEELAYTLREDDFFFIKLGSLKPKCERLKWLEPSLLEKARAEEVRRFVSEQFPNAHLGGDDPLFSFVKRLSAPLTDLPRIPAETPLRLGYSYFALYGDPLIDPKLDPYPDGYLERLARAGVNAVWLQGILSRLSPVPWSPERQIEERRDALRKLADRAAKHGIKLFLYLNEPRALSIDADVFRIHPDWRGVTEGDWAAVCTSSANVRARLREAVAGLCRSVPDLGGFFSISASENLTNCWSHYGGAACPKCRSRSPADVIAEVNSTFYEGIRAANCRQRMIVWDWGWQDAWVADAIRKLPEAVSLMSVSEWNLPIERGGVETSVGEYSLSSVGPGPRALRHWKIARNHGMRVIAKIQTGNSWELSAVPYLPVVDNVAQHVKRIQDAGVEDLMLGWTLGGHPSPNLDAIAEITAGGTIDSLAEKRFGTAGAVVAEFWRECSAAFREFPFHSSVVYNAPLQTGPANPLWQSPTGYTATIVGIPYDDIDAWRGPYPAEVFAAQLEKVATGFEAAVEKLGSRIKNLSPDMHEQLVFTQAATIHFSSVAQQTRFVMARRAGDHQTMQKCAQAEIELAKRLHKLQSADSRIAFEASNEYFYTPLDLVEKTINCRSILTKNNR